MTTKKKTIKKSKKDSPKEKSNALQKSITELKKKEEVPKNFMQIDSQTITNYEDMLKGGMREENEVKELLKNNNITMKTELSDDEIKSLTLLYYMSERYQFTKVKNMLDKFCELRVSKNRRGRKEFIEGIKNFFSNNNMMPFGGGNFPPQNR